LATNQSNFSNSFVLTNLLKIKNKTASQDLMKEMKDKEQFKERELTSKEKFANYLNSFVSINMINELNFRPSVLNNSPDPFGTKVGTLGSVVIREEVEDFDMKVKNKMRIIKESNLFKVSTPQKSKNGDLSEIPKPCDMKKENQ